VEEVNGLSLCKCPLASSVQQSACRGVPDQPGVYLVVWPYDTLPVVFLPSSTGGHFKGRNPTAGLPELRSHWVDGSKVVYIGKAGSAEGSATLRRRLWSYKRFGMGKPVGHWGGRYIWQFDGSGTLQICWRSTTGAMAELLEKQLVQDFASQYGRRPYANLRD